MKRFYDSKYYPEGEGSIETYIGTAREIKSLYKNLQKKTEYGPLFVDEPKFNPYKMYGLSIAVDQGFYTIMGETAIINLLMKEMESAA